MAGTATSVTAVQSLAWAQRGASGPAGTVQTSLLPTSAAQVAGATGVTVILPRLAGKSSLKVIGDVVAPLPLLAAVIVQLTVSPTVAVALSATFFTSTLGLLTVVLVWQSAGCRHCGASGPDGTTLFTATPACVTLAVTTMLARPPLPFKPAATLQLSTLPATGLQVAPVALTVMLARLAGKVSTSAIAARVAPLPVLVAVMVQLKVSPRFAAVWLATFLIATFGPVSTTFDWQSLAWAQAAWSGPPGTTRLDKLPSALPLAVMRMLRAPFTAANWPAAMLQVCTLLASQLDNGGQVTPASATTFDTVRLAGKISASVTTPWLAAPPLLTAVMVQTMLSPSLPVATLAVFVTRITAPGMVTIAVLGKSFCTSVELVAMLLTMVEILLAGWIYARVKLCVSLAARLAGKPVTVSMPLAGL